MKSKLTIIHISLFLCFAISCGSKKDNTLKEGEEAIVSVNGSTLYQYNLDEIISEELSPEDSTLAAEAYIKMWIKNELMYEKAQKNLTDKARIDELVESYKQTLTIFTYQEQLIQERLYKDISSKELQTYYESNMDKFKLKSNIIKGLFLKVPHTSPQLDNLKKWYRSSSEKSIENIEKYSLQNAVIYDYFYNKWVDFEDIMDNIPYLINDSQSFLKANKNLEVQDSTYVYLLNIKEYVLTGDKAPFDYAKGELMDILINQKREAYIKKIEDDLYNNAIKNKNVTFYKR